MTWNEWDINALLQGYTIPKQIVKHLFRSMTSKNNQNALSFAMMIKKENMKAVMCILSDESGGGSLSS